MTSMRARGRARLRATVFALALAAMASQVGGAAMAAGMAGGPPAALASVARVPVIGDTAARAWSPPLPGSWALLVAGLTGVWAIGRRRRSANRRLTRDRLRRP